jgi:hypothetical protein
MWLWFIFFYVGKKMFASEVLMMDRLFCGVLLLYIVVLFALVENEQGFFSTVLTIAFLFFIQLVLKQDVIGQVMGHPFLALGAVGVYFLIGSAWSVFKWYLYVKRRVENYFDMKSKWLNGKDDSDDKVRKAWAAHWLSGEADSDDKVREAWADYVSSQWDVKDLTFTPKVRDYKSNIIRWISFWPVSLTWWATHDIIKHIGTSIYNYIASTLQNVADKVYEKVKRDLPDEFDHK